MPGFALVGSLKSATRPGVREPYCTSLPVEVQSGRRYACPETGEERRQSAWRLTVPSALQPDLVAAAKLAGPGQAIVTASQLEEDEEGVGVGVEGKQKELPTEKADEEEMDEVDYQVGYENLSVLRSATGGVLRGRRTTGPEAERALRDFEQKERKSFRFNMLPRRTVLAVDLQGDVDADKIGQALRTIQASALYRKMKEAGTSSSSTASSPTSSSSPSSIPSPPEFGLLLWGTKAGFDRNGLPAMAVYEMQYSYRTTTVFLELESGGPDPDPARSEWIEKI